MRALRFPLRWLGPACLVLALTGCGARVAPDGHAIAPELPRLTPTEMASSLSAGPDEPAPDTETPLQGEATQTASPPSAPSPPAPGVTPSANPRHNDGRIGIALSGDCVTRGTPMVVTLRLPRNSGFGAVVGYSDYRHHGAMTAGYTDDSGQFVWRFVVAPSVPFGEATVLVSAGGEDWEGEGSTADAKFRVVASEGEC